jgi:CheY-like chemotaxis protein
VTDLEMPRLHGYELIETMRRHPRWGRIPIVVCTSRSSEKHRAKARALGASGYVTKPFTREELVGEVLRLWTGETGAAGGEAERVGPSLEAAESDGTPVPLSDAHGRS